MKKQNERIEKLMLLDWKMIEFFESKGEEDSLLYLNNGRKARVRHSFDEVLKMITGDHTLNDRITLDLVGWEKESENV